MQCPSIICASRLSEFLERDCASGALAQTKLGPPHAFLSPAVAASKCSPVIHRGRITEYRLPSAAQVPNNIAAGPDGNVRFEGSFEQSVFGGPLSKLVPTAPSLPSPPEKLRIQSYLGSRREPVVYGGRCDLGSSLRPATLLFAGLQRRLSFIVRNDGRP